MVKEKQINTRTAKKKLAILLLKYSLKRITRKKFPSWAYIYLTRRCNENCEYCFYTDNSIPEMSEKELISAIDKVYELGSRYISFFGGEPTLRKRELVTCIKHASLEKRMFTQLPTNGSLLDQKYLNELGESGLDILDMSLDSLNDFNGSKKTLSNRRDLFEKIQKSRERYNFSFKVNQVITPQNYQEIENLFEFAKENDAIVSVRLAFSPPLNEESSGNIYFKNSPEDVRIVERVSKKLIEKKKQGYKTSEPIEFYEAMPDFVMEKGNLWNCDAFSDNITIDCDGMLRLCGALPCSQGKLRIHFSELSKDYYDKIKQRAEDLKKKCNDKCFSAAYFCSQFYNHHPIKFFKNVALRV